MTTKGIKPDKIIGDDIPRGNKVNVIKGDGEAGTVFVDGHYLSPRDSQKIYNHSPDGFAWGYGGSGPAQLALAILMEFTSVTKEVHLYQDFKSEHVARWPMGKDFEVKIDIAGWIKNKTNKK